MLHSAWYLADGDWFTLLADAPRLDAEAEAVIGAVAELFGDESSFVSAKTVATMHVMLLAVDHLGDVIAHTTVSRDPAEVARLISGLNLVQAHLAQILQRVAHDIETHGLNGIAKPSDEAMQILTDNINHAGGHGELSAGHLKGVCRVLRAITQ